MTIWTQIDEFSCRDEVKKSFIVYNVFKNVATDVSENYLSNQFVMMKSLKFYFSELKEIFRSMEYRKIINKDTNNNNKILQVY